MELYISHIFQEGNTNVSVLHLQINKVDLSFDNADQSEYQFIMHIVFVQFFYLYQMFYKLYLVS